MTADATIGEIRTTLPIPLRPFAALPTIVASCPTWIRSSSFSGTNTHERGVDVEYEREGRDRATSRRPIAARPVRLGGR